MYNYPQDLIDFLTEQEADGAEIITTHNENATIWIIKPKGLSNRFVLVEWAENMETFSLVNLNNKALSRFLKEAN